MDRQDLQLSLHAVAIFVHDQDRSLRFYVDQLRFHLVVDARYESGRWVAVAPPDGTAVLGLVAPAPDSEEYNLIGRATHVVFIAEDVTVTFEEWRERGVRFHNEPHTPEWGGTFTTFEDLDGNSFALAGRDEVTQVIEAKRRATAERLEGERRAAQEMAIAQQVQAKLFPQSQPHLGTLDYAGTCIQAREVGGDYYDFLGLGPDRLGLVIGDISGKGIAAALLMANLQANLRSQCAIAMDQIQGLLRSVNRLFYENTIDSAYATLFFAEYAEKEQHLSYVNCGHQSALLLRNDNSLERLDSTATVLGLFRDWDCAMGECRLFPGDTLLLYTDGVTESFNDAEEEFGEQRLIEALLRHRGLPSQALVSSLVNELQQFSPGEQRDDITLIVAKCREAS